MNRINFTGASYKEWIGLSASPVFWVASLICFVLGLEFSREIGILIPGTSMDIIVIFSVGLGLANTAIQIVGNDTDKGDLGFALLLMWGASYMLGIGSNVNFLYSAIGLENKLLQFLVCWGLGIMIEVAPERLLVRFLRSVGVITSSGGSRTSMIAESKPQKSTMNPAQLGQYLAQEQTQRQKATSQYGKPTPRPSTPTSREPTYHSVDMRVEEENLPDFLKNRK